MLDWPDAMLRKCQIDQNTKLTKCQIDKMSSWQNVKLTKCQVDKMSSWQNNLAPPISKTSDFSRDLSIFQSKIPTVVESILNSCEFLKKKSFFRSFKNKRIWSKWRGPSKWTSSAFDSKSLNLLYLYYFDSFPWQGSVNIENHN
jgi:hypothetical protein